MKESLSLEELRERIKKVHSKRTRKEMGLDKELDVSTPDKEIEEIFSMDGVEKGEDWDKVHKEPKERS